MLALEPGGRLELALSPPQWCVEKTTVDGFVVVAELRPSTAQAIAMQSDGGRLVENPDVVAQPVSVSLFDTPGGYLGMSNGPSLLVAATCPSGSWRRKPITVTFGGQNIIIEPARAKSIYGHAEDILVPAAADLIDERNSIVIALADEDQWLTSCDDEALAAGENLAILGSEQIQFGRAVPLGDGRFRLSRLLRGRAGTEWACDSHFANDQFCLLKVGTIQPVALPAWAIGSEVSASAQGGPGTSIVFLGENIRPPEPINLSVEREDSGDLTLSWTRRSRQGFVWLDGIDAPLGETSEQYQVTLSGGSGSLELIVSQCAATIAAAELAALGAGPTTIDVRQIGDLAASRAAQLTLS